MALIDIEYGSLASSEIMNKNFMYLDNRISEASGDINTSISSLLSNIATINTRLAELSEELSEIFEDFTNKLDTLKLKTEILVNDSTMVPDWSQCIYVEQGNQYTVSSNGFVLLNPKSNASGELTINGVVVTLKTRANNYDNASQLMAIPVREGDVVVCNLECNSVYFLPTKNFKYESVDSNEEV